MFFLTGIGHYIKVKITESNYTFWKYFVYQDYILVKIYSYVFLYNCLLHKSLLKIWKKVYIQARLEAIIFGCPAITHKINFPCLPIHLQVHACMVYWLGCRDTSHSASVPFIYTYIQIQQTRCVCKLDFNQFPKVRAVKRFDWKMCVNLVCIDCFYCQPVTGTNSITALNSNVGMFTT